MLLVSPGSTSRPLPDAQAVRFGHPAQAAAFPASSAAGPTHPSFAFVGTFLVEVTAVCCCCGAEDSDCGEFAVSAMSSICRKRGLEAVPCCNSLVLLPLGWLFTSMSSTIVGFSRRHFSSFTVSCQSGGCCGSTYQEDFDIFGTQSPVSTKRAQGITTLQYAQCTDCHRGRATEQVMESTTKPSLLER